MPEPVKPSTTFTFEGLALRRLIFQEVPNPETVTNVAERPASWDTNLNVSISVGIDTTGTKAEVACQATVEPDNRYQPYHIEVWLSGLFSMSEGGAKEELEKFAQLGAPAVLWPYVRETVRRVTGDARFGPVALGLLNMTQAVRDGTWSQEVRTPAPPPSTASGGSPP